MEPRLYSDSACGQRGDPECQPWGSPPLRDSTGKQRDSDLLRHSWAGEFRWLAHPPHFLDMRSSGRSESNDLVVVFLCEKSWGHQNQNHLRFRNQSNFEQPDLMEHSLAYCLRILPVLEVQITIFRADSCNFGVFFKSAINVDDPAFEEGHYSNEL